MWGALSCLTWTSSGESRDGGRLPALHQAYVRVLWPSWYGGYEVSAEWSILQGSPHLVASDAFKMLMSSLGLHVNWRWTLHWASMWTGDGPCIGPPCELEMDPALGLHVNWRWALHWTSMLTGKHWTFMWTGDGLALDLHVNWRWALHWISMWTGDGPCTPCELEMNPALGLQVNWRWTGPPCALEMGPALGLHVNWRWALHWASMWTGDGPCTGPPCELEMDWTSMWTGDGPCTGPPYELEMDPVLDLHVNWRWALHWASMWTCWSQQDGQHLFTTWCEVLSPA